MRPHSSILFAVLALFALTFSPAHARAADAPPPPQAPPSAASPAAPVPAPSPVVGAGMVPVVARREDTEVRVNADLNMIQRAVARLSGITTDSAAIQQLATAQAEINTLRAQVTALTAERDSARQSLATYQAELANLHQVLTSPDPAAAMRTPEGAAAAAAVSANVAGVIRAIGVDASTLPVRTAAADGSANTIERLQAQLAAAKTPAERQALLAANATLILRSK